MPHLASAQNVRIIPEDTVEDILRLPVFDKFYDDMVRVIEGWRSTHRFGSGFHRAEKVGEADREEIIEEAEDAGFVRDFSRLHNIYRPVQTNWPSYADRVNALSAKISLLSQKLKDAESNNFYTGSNTIPEGWSESPMETSNAMFLEDYEDAVYGALNSLLLNIEGWDKDEMGEVNEKFYSQWHRLDYDYKSEVNVAQVIDRWVNYMANKVFLEDDYAWFADWIFADNHSNARLPNGAAAYLLDFDSATELVEGLSDLGDALFELRSNILGKWQNVIEMIPTWSADPLVVEIGQGIAGIEEFWKFYQKGILDIGQDISEAIYAARTI
ncbi:hypothetical protein AA313_de0203394 [Arthrobotrys entomopaga]|nr:hypothetical protein AA313_de0203394 [Arthrobotrys entomopaga]